MKINFLILDSWNEVSYYYEQPYVNFDDQLIIFKTTGNKEQKFSTIIKLNEILDTSDLFENSPLIKYEFFDDDNDKIKDKFRFKITFQEENVEKLKNIKLIFLFRYELGKQIVGRMNTVAMVDIDTPLGASYIKVDGDLKLKQKVPIDKISFYNEYEYENKFDNEKEIKDYDFNDIAEEYYSRDFSTIYEYDTYIVPMQNPNVVKLEVNINIPAFQEILYRTSTFAKIKFFWCQYMAILIPVAGVFYFIMQFVFRNQIVTTINSNDIGAKKQKIL